MAGSVVEGVNDIIILAPFFRRKVPLPIIGIKQLYKKLVEEKNFGCRKIS
jgi:hypothetical protein